MKNDVCTIFVSDLNLTSKKIISYPFSLSKAEIDIKHYGSYTLKMYREKLFYGEWLN